MWRALGNGDPLLRFQLDGAVTQVDEQLPFEYKKELVVIVVLVPVIFTLHDAEAHHAVIHLGEGLIEPFVRTFRNELGNVHPFEVVEFHVELCDVVEFVFHVDYVLDVRFRSKAVIEQPFHDAFTEGKAVFLMSGWNL